MRLFWLIPPHFWLTLPLPRNAHSPTLVGNTHTLSLYFVFDRSNESPSFENEIFSFQFTVSHSLTHSSQPHTLYPSTTLPTYLPTYRYPHIIYLLIRNYVHSWEMTKTIFERSAFIIKRGSLAYSLKLFSFLWGQTSTAHNSTQNYFFLVVERFTLALH